MSKGSKRRPSFVSNEEYTNNYNRIFKGVEPEIPTVTQVECTAIVKYVPPDQDKIIDDFFCLVQNNDSGIFKKKPGEGCLEVAYRVLHNVDCSVLCTGKFSPGFPDLTKMDHPTACEYLAEGMRAKILRRADNYELGWDSVWIEAMDKRIGGVYTIDEVDSLSGIHFAGIDCTYPAFCLQIIEQENTNGS